MTVTLELAPEIERVLLTQADARGVSLDDYLQEVLSRQAGVSDAAEIERDKLIEIPLLHFGVLGPLRRTDIYDDISDAG